MTDPSIFVPDLIRWEGHVPWMYRDVMGYVTVGIGSMIHDADDACTYPFKRDSLPASHAEIQREFLRVISMPKAKHADSYRAPSEPRVELDDNGVRDCAISRLKHEFIPGLQRLFVGFDGFPVAAQRALVDMAWNLGIHGLSQFSNLREAVARGDWKSASESCHRKTSRDERNDWTANLFRAAQRPDST